MPTIAELPSDEVPEAVRHEIARKAMSAHFCILRAKGKTCEALDPEQFYGFRPADVVEIHFYKQGFGKGLWYRLKDGRVISALGKPSNPERYWYLSDVH